MNKVRFTTLFIFVISVFGASAFTAISGQTQDDQDKKYWALSQKYCNDRFGFCVYYPASLIKAASPENNDGSRFDNGNGLEMTVSGINNTSHDTLKSEMSSARTRFDKITYRAKGKNWFILKGQKADVIIFLKTYVGQGSVNHLEIQVPVPLKTNYTQVVKNVAGSFSPGRLSAAH